MESISLMKANRAGVPCHLCARRLIRGNPLALSAELAEFIDAAHRRPLIYRHTTETLPNSH